MKNYLIDIDGVVCRDIPNEEPERMIEAEEIEGAREWINSLHDAGHHICFFTARLYPAHASVTEKWLNDHGFKFDQIIYGKPRGGNYHYVDNLHVQATTFKGKFAPLKRKQVVIEVFED
jgi:hypothetical protein